MLNLKLQTHEYLTFLSFISTFEGSNNVEISIESKEVKKGVWNVRAFTKSAIDGKDLHEINNQLREEYNIISNPQIIRVK